MLIYEQFISHCRELEKNLLESDHYREIHHIIPRHAGGGDESQNLIALSRYYSILY